MKRLVPLLLFVLAGCANLAGHLPSSPPSFDIPRATTVSVRVGDFGAGSGVVVSDTLVLVAAHMVPPEARNEAITVTDRKVPAYVLAVSDKADVALLHAEVGCPCAHMTRDPLALNTPVALVGYPQNTQLGNLQVLTRGEYQGIIQREEGRYMIMTSPSAPGNSGGGAYAYRNGRWEVVGIMSKIPVHCVGDEKQHSCVPVFHIAVVVGYEDVRAFLQDFANHRTGAFRAIAGPTESTSD